MLDQPCSESRCGCSRHREGSLCHRIFYGRTAGVLTQLPRGASQPKYISQAYHWAVMYPSFVERIVAICSAARTSLHNRWFELNFSLCDKVIDVIVPPNDSIIEGPKHALIASKDFHDGEYKSTPRHGIKAFGRSLFSWAYDPSVSGLKGRVVINMVLRYILSVLSRTFIHDERSVSIWSVALRVVP